MLPWPDGTIIAVTSLPSHDLHWSEEKPAFAEVCPWRESIKFLVAPPTRWSGWWQGERFNWNKRKYFPVHSNGSQPIARPATDDEIAVVNALRAMLADPLPDLEET